MDLAKLRFYVMSHLQEANFRRKRAQDLRLQNPARLTEEHVALGPSLKASAHAQTHFPCFSYNIEDFIKPGSFTQGPMSASIIFGLITVLKGAADLASGFSSATNRGCR